MEHCPHLPVPDKPISAADARLLGHDERGAAFYELRLAYAQTKLLEGLPAQAILQLNRALSADIAPGEEILARWPLPYAAIAWILDARPDREGLFLGNPRRHWQHYATRMSGPLAELRCWRSWACWWLCHGRLSADEFPVDREQIEHEKIALPDREDVETCLRRLGLPGEANLWQEQLVA